MKAKALMIAIVAGVFGGITSANVASEHVEALPLEATFSTTGWSIGPQISSFHYEEPDFMEEDGILYGVSLCYTSFAAGAAMTDILYRLEGGIAAGEVDYDGQLQDGTPYTIDGNTDVLANVRLLWGPVWHTDKWSNHLYGGIAYRYLGDDSSHDPTGYQRRSNYFYLPLGFKRGQKLGGNWYLGLGAEFDLLLYGVQLSDVPGESDTVSNSQTLGSGVGVRGSLKLRHKTENLDLAIEPFIQHWSVDDSEIARGDFGIYLEPENNSTQYGLDIMFYF